MNELKKKIKDELEDIVGVGYILYIADSKKMNCVLYPLMRMQPSIRISATNEIFSLGKPAFNIDGKPVFVCIRNCPYSIEFEMLEEKIVDKIEEAKEKGFRYIERNYSASEIDAKVNSVYTNNVFRKKAIDSITVIIFILSVLLAIAITVIIMNQIHNAEMNSILYPETETVEALNIIRSLKYVNIRTY